MKALDRSVEMLSLWIVTSLVTFIRSVNQSTIKSCLTFGLLPKKEQWKHQKCKINKNDIYVKMKVILAVMCTT